MKEEDKHYGEFPNILAATKDFYLGKKKQRFQVNLRFANEACGYTKASLHPSLLEEVTIFKNEVFATVDGLRIAIPREDYDKMMDFYEI